MSLVVAHPAISAHDPGEGTGTPPVVVIFGAISAVAAIVTIVGFLYRLVSSCCLGRDFSWVVEMDKRVVPVVSRFGNQYADLPKTIEL